MNKDLAVIIQGPSNHVIDLKKSWEGYNLIWSTWIGEEGKYDKKDIVLFNEIPIDRGVQNIALQKTSILNGILKAKELGYKRVLKWRSDLLPSNAQKLVNTFKKNCINFLTWHNTGKYFIDYFTEGDIDDIFNIWNLPTIHGPYPEKILTDNIFFNNFLNFNFIGEELNETNDIYWAKYNINLSSYKKEECYKMQVIK
jgi:hypothetical protein